MTLQATAERQQREPRERKHEPAPACSKCGSVNTFVDYTVKRAVGRIRHCYCGNCCQTFKESRGGQAAAEASG
jgi:hypothetical protein